MTEIDTSAAEVERLCHNLEVAHQAGDGDEDLPTAAATLRALAAERDAVSALMAARGTNRDHWENRAVKAEADRDRLAAENALLRRAWLRVIQAENSCAPKDQTGTPCHAKRCGCAEEQNMLIREAQQPHHD